MSDAFIAKAVAVNCALMDHHHVCGNVEAAAALIRADAEAARRSTGPRNWTPLLYLCFSRLLRDPEQQES